MKFNRDMLFAAGTVVAVVIAAVAAVLLFGGISKFSTAEKRLQASIKKLRGFYEDDPFPSDENVEREKQNAARLREWYGKLITSLREGEIAPDPSDTSPSRWTSMYGAIRSELRKQATDKGVGLPADFAFGFDEYALGAQPPPPDVPLLTQHLKIVKFLSTLLIEEDVDAIQALKREAIGEAKTAVVQRPRTSSSGGGSLVGGASSRRQSTQTARQPGATKKRPGKKAAAKVEPQGPLYARQHFELEFRAKEQTVLNILNKLAKNPAFTVVTSVEMVREGDDILKAEQTIRKTGEGVIPLAEMRGDDYPSSLERMVCGAELEKPMLVRIKLNIYNFVGE